MEMYRVFNMGHRMEVYVDEEEVDEIIEISNSFNVDAQVIGRVEEASQKEVVIRSPYGEFTYH